MKTRRAKVIYSYAPQNDDELKLEVDDVIEIIDEIEEGWWKGVTPKGITGVFPSNFVVEVTSDSPKINKKDVSDKNDSDSLDGNRSSLNRDDSLEKKPKPIAKVGFGNIFAGGIIPKLSPIGDLNKSVPQKPPPPTPATAEAEAAPKLPPKPVREQAKVLFAYEAQNEDELTIKEGDIITIVSKEIEDVGWWKGELNGRIALFPDNFVELIKSEELNSTKATKKPERPTEKPPPIANHSKAPNLLKSDSIKSSNKTFEELPKTTPIVVPNTSSGVNSAPVIPGKPSLNSSLFKPKPKSEPPTVPSSVKPDVVPQENGSKHERDTESNDKPNVINNGSENHFTSMDATSNKLTHLTQSRPKGPSSRRPPSALFLAKEPENESKENGDVLVVQQRIETNSSHPSIEQKQTPAEKSPPEKTDKLPPWMVELRKAQEKRKPEDTPKTVLNSPTKTSPNRFSGDFSNKSLQQSSTLDDSDSNTTPFKPPLKSIKPIITTTPVTTEPVTTVSTLSSTVTTTANTTSKIVISSATTATPKPTPKVDVINSSTEKKSDPSELEKEIRALKESTASRKDFDLLVKEVIELKEVVKSQKDSYNKIIKDLINDVAEEQKKLATLQIEVERLRKLSTTV